MNKTDDTPPPAGKFGIKEIRVSEGRDNFINLCLPHLFTIKFYPENALPNEPHGYSFGTQNLLFDLSNADNIKASIHCNTSKEISSEPIRFFGLIPDKTHVITLTTEDIPGRYDKKGVQMAMETK